MKNMAALYFFSLSDTYASLCVCDKLNSSLCEGSLSLQSPESRRIDSIEGL